MFLVLYSVDKKAQGFKIELEPGTKNKATQSNVIKLSTKTLIYLALL